MITGTLLLLVLMATGSMAVKCQDNYNVYVLIDSSTKTQLTDWNRMKAGASMLIRTVNVRPNKGQVGLGQFSLDFENIFDLSRHVSKATILQELASLKQRGPQRATGQALATVRKSGYLTNSLHGSLVLFLGGPSDNVTLATREAINLRKEGVQIFVVTYPVNLLEAAAIAGSATRVFLLTPLGIIDNLLLTLLNLLCTAATPPATTTAATSTTTPVTTTAATSTTTPVTTTAATSTTTPVTTTTATTPVTTTAATSTTPPVTTKAATSTTTPVTTTATGLCVPITRAEVLFLIEASDFVGAANIRLVKDFLKQAVADLDVGPQVINVAIVTYGSSAQVVTPLLDNRDALNTEIESITVVGGNADLAAGLDQATNTLFDSVRNNAQPFIYLVASSQSTNSAQATANADAAKSFGIIIVAQAVADGALQDLQSVSSSDRQVAQVEDYSQLPQTASAVSDRICDVTN